MYLTKELRQKALEELRWLAMLLETDLNGSDWPAEAFAARVRERALNAALAIEKLGAPAPEPKPELYSLFTHKGRVHVQFPPAWVEGANPLYAYSDSRDGAVAYIYFPAVGRAFKLYEDWSGLQANIGQPIPVVEPVDPEGIEWSAKAPRIFEPLSVIERFGGSNEPIVLGA